MSIEKQLGILYSETDSLEKALNKKGLPTKCTLDLDNLIHGEITIKIVVEKETTKEYRNKLEQEKVSHEIEEEIKELEKINI